MKHSNKSFRLLTILPLLAALTAVSGSSSSSSSYSSSPVKKPMKALSSEDLEIDDDQHGALKLSWRGAGNCSQPNPREGIVPGGPSPSACARHPF